MAKQTSDFRYNTGATKVPWATVGENLKTESSTFVTNATAGFEIAYKYANLKAGDEVIVPSYTFSLPPSRSFRRALFPCSVT